MQDQIRLPYNFIVLAGARYQYIRENNGLSGSPTFAVNTTSNPANIEQAVTPRFGLLWRPEQWVSFYANYTEGFGQQRRNLPKHAGSSNQRAGR